jgi:hemerythrin-like domain-containing protein
MKRGPQGHAGIGFARRASQFQGARHAHAGAKNLIRELKAMDADDDLYDAKVNVLGENIGHHVEEEETELFPRVRKSSTDLDDVGARMEARKEELMASAQALEPLPNE